MASRYFFWGVLALFAVEGLWFAFTFRHPMLFDEVYHFGLIKLYAEQWSPFIGSQPLTADAFGDVVHYPSFLYHYLMSFPHRIVSGLTGSEMAQVISLRVLNIGMVVAGLWLFRKVLLQLKLSPGLSNFVLLLFSLLPIVPMLSAQISYDNLLFTLVAASLFLALRLVQAERLSFATLAALLTVNMAASMVKFTFLPVFAAEFVFLAVLLLRRHGKGLGQELISSFRKTSKPLLAALLTGFVIITGMFGIRYGGNVIAYQNPAPDCQQVLPVNRCMSYGPWGRNEQLAQQMPEGAAAANPVKFTLGWVKVMYNDLFRVAGIRVSDNQPEYSAIYPIIRLAATLIIVTAVVTVVYRWRYIHGSPTLYLVLAVAIAYVGVLWLRNYQDFLYTGERVGTQGRYLLPMALPVLAVFGYVMSRSLHNMKLLKVNAAILAVPLFLQGGGMFAGIVASQPSWYWQNKVVIEQNENLQQVVRPFVRTSL